MLILKIPEKEVFNPITSEIIFIKETTLKLEHSLYAMALWESKWCKPFLSIDGTPKSKEESADYIRCMTINIDEVDDRIFELLSPSEQKVINDYMGAKHTATWFSEKEGQSRRPKEVVTTEVIYHWMIEAGIPAEFDKWNFDRLNTLIRVRNEKSGNQKKMSKNEILRNNAQLNAARRQRLGTKG